MDKIAIGVATSVVLSAGAQTFNFDSDAPGSLPAGWQAGVTGRGAARWSVEPDASAPSKPNILKQSGRGDFPWCVRSNVALADGFVEVRFKPVAGSEDQAGGIVWRWKDGGNYYVARANALENNVSLYHTTAEFNGKHIRVILDGKGYIELDDEHIQGPGAVGMWTKADSVTLFDDFAFGP